MRRHNEPVQVRTLALPEDGTRPRPEQFIWRGRLWRVLEVQRCWVELGAWWTSGAVRAARGESVPAPQGGREPVASRSPGHYQDWDATGPARPGGKGDGQSTPGLPGQPQLASEEVVWRLEARCGAAGERGVFDLAWCGSGWTMRAVLD